MPEIMGPRISGAVAAASQNRKAKSTSFVAGSLLGLGIIAAAYENEPLAAAILLFSTAGCFALSRHYRNKQRAADTQVHMMLNSSGFRF